MRAEKPSMPVVAGDRERRWIVYAQACLTIAGIVVAGYLTYAYTAGGSMVCGPGGGCEGVRSSAYASLVGIPVPVVGLASYVIIGLLLAIRARLSGSISYAALLAALTVSSSGLVFSWYLTYVELFVLKMVCDWCVASAVVITVIAVLSCEEARREIRGWGSRGVACGRVRS